MDSPHGDPRKVKNFCSREEVRVLRKIQGRTAALPVACFGLAREEYVTEYQQRHTRGGEPGPTQLTAPLGVTSFLEKLRGTTKQTQASREHYCFRSLKKYAKWLSRGGRSLPLSVHCRK